MTGGSWIDRRKPVLELQKSPQCFGSAALTFGKQWASLFADRKTCVNYPFRGGPFPLDVSMEIMLAV